MFWIRCASVKVFFFIQKVKLFPRRYQNTGEFLFDGRKLEVARLCNGNPRERDHVHRHNSTNLHSKTGSKVFALHSRISLKVCITLFSLDHRFTKLGSCGSYKTELVKYRTARTVIIGRISRTSRISIIVTWQY